MPKIQKNHCIVALIYNKFSYTAYTQKIMIFESLMRIINNKLLWIIFACSSFISGDINLEIFPFPKPLNLGKMYTITYL